MEEKKKAKKKVILTITINLFLNITKKGNIVKCISPLLSEYNIIKYKTKQHNRFKELVNIFQISV